LALHLGLIEGSASTLMRTQSESIEQFGLRFAKPHHEAQSKLERWSCRGCQDDIGAGNSASSCRMARALLPSPARLPRFERFPHRLGEETHQNVRDRREACDSRGDTVARRFGCVDAQVGRVNPNFLFVWRHLYQRGLSTVDALKTEQALLPVKISTPTLMPSEHSHAMASVKKLRGA
jgi:hypothetical protein